MSSANRDNLLHQAADRAATDMSFRRRLLTSPEAALLEAFGLQLPPGHRVRFIEKPANVDTLVVLPPVHQSSEELDDADLDAAAGGDGGSAAPW